MQIVIKLPESIYDTIQSDEMISREQLAVLQMYIMNGTPLPKAENHGFIAVCDSLGAVTQEVANKLKNTVFVGDEDCSYCFDIMEIIEADGGGAE